MFIAYLEASNALMIKYQHPELIIQSIQDRTIVLCSDNWTRLLISSGRVLEGCSGRQVTSSGRVLTGCSGRQLTPNGRVLAGCS